MRIKKKFGIELQQIGKKIGINGKKTKRKKPRINDLVRF